MSCQKCNGTGMVDSGGVQPWGEPILVECDCLYRERDAWELDQAGGYYSRHVMAMTSEGLHSKGDIAAELGYRDMRIDQLEAEWRAQEERAENAETNLVDMRAAEQALSDSYIRLRQIVGAMNPPGVTSEEVWAHTEKKAQELRDRCEALEAVAKDFLRRNKYGPLFYRDLYNRFKEVIGD